MNTNTSASSAPPSRRKNWKWVALTVVVVGALSVPTAVVYLQNRLANQHRFVRAWDDPKVAAKLDAMRLAKAKVLREDVRAWALQNRDGLRAMLVSNGNDLQSLQKVRDKCPFVNFAGTTLPDAMSGAARFSWLIDPAKLLNADVKMSAYNRQKIQGAVSRSQQLLKQQFTELSDFSIASSQSPGPVETYLWASGRITEKRWVQNPDQRRGQPVTITLPHKELVPPFDFLTSAKGS